MARAKILKAAAVVLAAGILAGCEENGSLPRNSRHYVPIPGHMISLMAEKGTTKQQPILLRAYKQESELEVWKQKTTGEYVLLKTYPMCRWSGQLGPKVREGDRQVPEGFYSITPAQLNPNSSFYLSFNVGYPNAYDRAHGRTGAHIMVHGACSSMGCFSMTDEQIAEIYAITREAFAGGQKAIQMQSLPFRYTPQNLAKFRADPHMPFWKMLKEGADSFDVTKREPQVAVCASRYVFNRTAKGGARFESTSACPPTEVDEAVVAAVQEKNRADEVKVAELIQSGTRAVRRLYKDGDQHHSFRGVEYAQVAPDSTSIAATGRVTSRVAEVSRPDALDHGPVEIPVDSLKDKGGKKTAAQLAASLTSQKPAEATASVSTPARPAAAGAPVQAQAAAIQPASAQQTSGSAQSFAPASPAPASGAFRSGWLSWGAKEEAPAPVAGQELDRPVPANVPAPPKAPPRQASSPAPDKTVDAGKSAPAEASRLSGFTAMLPNWR